MHRFTFIGGTFRGYCLLEALFEKGYKPVSGVILKEDDHEILKYSDKISELLKSHNIPHSIKKKLSPDDYEQIKKIKPDFIIVFGWRTLIDTDISRNLKYGLIAAHFSLLPKYRGFAPAQWAVINGEKETGVTLLQITEGEADSGKIVSQRKIAIDADEYISELDEKLINISVELYFDFFKAIDVGKITFTEQDESAATYACKRIPEDGKINWNDSAYKVYNLIRALASPYPGAFCFYKENSYSIRKAKLGDDNKKKYSGNIPGRVIKIKPEGIEVLCGEGTLFIYEWENMNDGKVSNPSDVIKSITSTLK